MADVALNGLARPAYGYTRKLRQDNLMLRMLEIPFSKSQTAQEAANTLTRSRSNAERTNGPGWLDDETKRSFESVVSELIEGLESGAISLRDLRAGHDSFAVAPCKASVERVEELSYHYRGEKSGRPAVRRPH